MADAFLEIGFDDEKVRKGLDSLEKDAAKSGKGIGSALGNLAGGLTPIGLALTGINQGLELAGKLATGVKAALNFSFEIARDAEAIASINRQFEMLTDRAGVAGDALRDALMQSSGGLLDDDDVMKAANKALIEMGDSAAKLPQIMEIASKAARMNFGDIASNFEAINQAIMSGNTRALKNIGIFIDADRAVKDFARAHGQAAEAITETGRQQAILEAVLKKGGEAFKGVSPVQPVTDAFTKMKVAIGDAADEMKIAFTTVFGPTLEKMANQVATVAERFSKTLAFMFKSDEERQAQIKQMVEDQQKAQISSAVKGLDLSGVRGLPTAPVTINTGGDNKPGETDSGAGKNLFDPKIAAQRKAQLEQQLLGFNQARFAAEQALIANSEDSATKITQLDRLAAEQRDLIAQEFEMKKQTLRAQNDATHLMSKQQLAQAELQIEQEKQLRLAAIQDESVKRQKAAQAEVNQALNNTFRNVAVSAIATFGAALVKGTKAFEEFGKNFLGTIGDLAIQIGTFMLFGAQGLLALYSGNPAGAMMFGAALIAIGGALKALAGNGSSADGGGGVASSASTGASSDMTTQPDLEEQKAKTEVHVNIQGNVLDRRESGIAIVEMLNEHFSANDGRLVSAV